MIFRNMVRVNLFPVTTINILFLPLWIVNKILLNSVLIPGDYKLFNGLLHFKQIMSVTEAIFNVIINPIYLNIVNMACAIKTGNKKYIKNIFLMILSCFTGLMIYFFNWCISEGSFFNHDRKDIVLAKYMMFFTLAQCLALACLNKYFC